MIVLVFAVRDKAVEAFMPPFFARSKGEAVRSFMTACTDNNGPFVKFLGDYELYHIGAFNDGNGSLESIGPDRIMSGLEVSAPSS